MLTKMTEVTCGTPAPTLGLDLDGVIDEAPIFFQILSQVWPGRVIVVSFNDDRGRVEAKLDRFGIRYDELILVDRFDAKAEVIAEKGIAIYIDDQPEMMRNIPETVAVMLFRNGGNYTYDENLWLMSPRTGRLM